MTMLELRGVSATYGSTTVLHDVDLQIRPGETYVILGVNGAGKTTTLRAISGLVRRRGTINFEGKDIARLDPADIARLGIGHVPEGRGTFRELSVLENLKLGALRRRDRAAVANDLDRQFALFPRLRERLQQPAGNLSGGEQQMLAVARALMARPRMLLLDEPTLGLAPIVSRELFETFAQLAREDHLTMLIVEQNAQISLGIAQQACILEAGAVATRGNAQDMLVDDRIKQIYLGL